jgi:hypothetical protein
MDQTAQMICAFVFGVGFIIAILVLAIRYPTPTPYQYRVFRIVLSLAAGGVAAMIPGLINVEFNPIAGFLIRAGGAVAVFVIVFFFNPASLVAEAPNTSLSTAPRPSLDRTGAQELRKENGKNSL